MENKVLELLTGAIENADKWKEGEFGTLEAID